MENQIPTAPVVTPQVATEQPKQSNFLVILLSVLLFISVAIAVFFAYQTQKLVKELRVKNEELRANATPIAKVEPVTIIDPTADWKTYTNTKNNYSLKYPDGYTVGQNGMNSNQPETVDFAVVYKDFDKAKLAVSVWPKSAVNDFAKMANDHYLKLSTYKPPAEFNLYQKMNNEAIKPITQGTFINMKSFSYTIKGNYVEDGAAESVYPIKTYKYLWIDSGSNIFLISHEEDAEMDQILSSFKFTN